MSQIDRVDLCKCWISRFKTSCNGVCTIEAKAQEWQRRAQQARMIKQFKAEFPDDEEISPIAAASSLDERGPAGSGM